MPAEIAQVISGSIADELDIKNGDYLISINGVTPQDILDYRYLSVEECVQIEIEKPNQQRLVFEIEKESDEDLGFVFKEDTFDEMKRCKNKCIFCFVDQMPPNLRGSLYIKDDDYRLSLLYGNFITLTNLKEADLARIIEMHISPLYLSVHSTEPDLRKKMLNHPKAGKIVSYIRRLAEAGIEMHTQIVLCPGINDGEHLKTSILTLQNYWPQVSSIAVVPVGITKYQNNSYLRTFTKGEAKEIIHKISNMQEKFKITFGSNFVFLADEFYLLGEEKIPGYSHYEGFPQMENGVGLSRFLWDDFKERSIVLPRVLKTKRKVLWITGKTGALVSAPIVKQLSKIRNLEVQLKPITNEFFGSQVTVTGLLTGHDLIYGLKDWKGKVMEHTEIFISSSMLKYGTELFLDNLNILDVENILGCHIRAIEPTGQGIVEAIEKL